MTPRNSAPSVSDGMFRYAKPQSKCPCVSMGRSDYTHIVLRQFGQGVLGTVNMNHQPHIVSVLNVGTSRRPFEVRRAVIGLVAVFVIDFFARAGAWWKEGVSDETVNISPSGYGVSERQHPQVTEVMHNRREYASRFIVANATQVRDRITRMVADNAPLFSVIINEHRNLSFGVRLPVVATARELFFSDYTIQEASI